MRSLFGLVVVFAAVAAPASAQARFVESCVAEAEGIELGGLDPAAVCQCAAETAIARGIPAATVDAVVDHDGTSGEPVPDVVQAAGALLSEGLMACALSEDAAEVAPVDAAAEGVSEAPVEAVTGAPVDAVTGAPVQATPSPQPAGDFRTGNGTGPVRTQQDGKGGAIRIVG